MSKRGRNKGGDSKLRQTTMGDFMSKQDKSAKTQSTKRKGKSRMFSSFWTRGSQRDTEEYRNGYPGKKDHEDLDDNYKFYMNQIPSKPDGDFIDKIHAQWADDYRKLECHHGYIQWLFPIRESGMNWHAQELQLHEIKKITANRKAKARVLKSYEMMLGFYGMKLVNKEDGSIERADNWVERFQHLNRSFHNYLRITRILKSLGELGYEHLKANFVRFVLIEGMTEDTLPNVIESCVKFWIGVIKNDEERQELLALFDELNDETDKKPRSISPDLSPIPQRRTRNSRQFRQIRRRSDSEEEEDNTLEYAMNLIDSDDEKDKKVKRKEHDMSDSDEDDNQEADSQEMQHWRGDNDNGSEDADEVAEKGVVENIDDATDDDSDKVSGMKLNEDKNIAVKNRPKIMAKTEETNKTEVDEPNKTKKEDVDVTESQEMQHRRDDEDIGSEDEDEMAEKEAVENIDDAADDDSDKVSGMKLNEDKNIANKNRPKIMAKTEETNKTEVDEPNKTKKVENTEKLNDNGESGKNQGAGKENDQAENIGDRKDNSGETKAPKNDFRETECKGEGDISEEPIESKDEKENKGTHDEGRADTEKEVQTTELEAMDTSNAKEKTGGQYEVKEETNATAEEIDGTKMDTE